MVKAQGYEIGEDGELVLPEGVTPKMQVPTDLVPHCPVCGELMTVNLAAMIHLWKTKAGIGHQSVTMSFSEDTRT